MGFTNSEKTELAAYQCRDNSPLRGGSVTLEILKKAFLDLLFPRGKSEPKVEEFINLRQGGMSLLYYSLRFSKFSSYAPSLVSDHKFIMRRFVTGVSDNMKEECRLTFLNYNMNISHIMVYAQHVKDTRK